MTSSTQKPEFLNAIQHILHGFTPKREDANAYLSMCLTCICCHRQMVWLHRADGDIYRCETEACPQFHEEFLPFHIKLERSKK